MSLFINKISTQTMTETADILFPFYNMLRIQIIHRFITLESVAKWIHGGLPILKMWVRASRLLHLFFFFIVIIIKVRIQH